MIEVISHKDILSKLKIGRTSFYKLRQSGCFLPPIRLGGTGKGVWLKTEVAQLQQAMLAGASQPELQALTARLIQARNKL